MIDDMDRAAEKYRERKRQLDAAEADYILHWGRCINAGHPTNDLIEHMCQTLGISQRTAWRRHHTWTHRPPQDNRITVTAEDTPPPPGDAFTHVTSLDDQPEPATWVPTDDDLPQQHTAAGHSRPDIASLTPPSQQPPDPRLPQPGPASRIGR